MDTYTEYAITYQEEQGSQRTLTSDAFPCRNKHAHTHTFS